ncbi:MAG: phage portal protein [Atopobiaceae bacterium]|nr:phage portal protein [Atopobiaceae bacterium]
MASNNPLSKLIGKLRHRMDARARTASYFQTLTEYSPSFRTWRGGVYEMELTRACVHAFASACSKGEPHIEGKGRPELVKAFRSWPNPYMTWPRFLYRLATIYEVDCTAFVIPTYDDRGYTNGLFPIRPETTDLIDVDGEMWVRFTLRTGEQMAFPASDVCCISKYQYLSDYFGTSNNLQATMDLLNKQVQAEHNAVELGGKIKFIGKVVGQFAPEDQRRKRDEFYARNFTDNDTVLMTYDSTFADITQVKASTYTISTDEMERIDKHVFDYFGCNEAILQNSADEAKWDSYYEGKVETFFLHLSEGLTQSCFSRRMVTQSDAPNRIWFGSDRLQFVSAATKRNIVRDMTSYGIMTVNEGRAILDLPKLPGMDVFMVRGEFFQMDMSGRVVFASGGREGLPVPDPVDDPDFDLGGDDQIYNDADAYGAVEKADV